MNEDMWRYSSLTCTLDGGEWSDSRSGQFNPGEKGFSLPVNRRCGVIYSQCEGLQKIKISWPLSVVQPVAKSLSWLRNSGLSGSNDDI